MVRETEKWLTSNPIAVNEGWSIGDYAFTVVAKSPGTQLEVLTPIEEVWIDSDTLAKDIRDKVSRYDDVAEKLGVPLIVVVGADDNLAVSSDIVNSALGGQLSVSLNLNVWGIGTGSTKSRPMKMHATDAPRSWNTALSGVGWLEAAIDEPGTITLFSYAKAARGYGWASGDGSAATATPSALRADSPISSSGHADDYRESIPCLVRSASSSCHRPCAL